MHDCTCPCLLFFLFVQIVYRFNCWPKPLGDLLIAEKLPGLFSDFDLHLKLTSVVMLGDQDKTGLVLMAFEAYFVEFYDVLMVDFLYALKLQIDELLR